MSPAVRPANAGPTHALVVELAADERLVHEVRSTSDSVVAALFGERPRAFCDSVGQGGQRLAGAGA